MVGAMGIMEEATGEDTTEAITDGEDLDSVSDMDITDIPMGMDTLIIHLMVMVMDILITITPMIITVMISNRINRKCRIISNSSHIRHRINRLLLIISNSSHIRHRINRLLRIISSSSRIRASLLQDIIMTQPLVIPIWCDQDRENR
jgi:hypothetical protein